MRIGNLFLLALNMGFFSSSTSYHSNPKPLNFFVLSDSLPREQRLSAYRAFPCLPIPSHPMDGMSFHLNVPISFDCTRRLYDFSQCLIFTQGTVSVESLSTTPGMSGGALYLILFVLRNMNWKQ